MIKLRFINDGGSIIDDAESHVIQAVQYGFWCIHVDAVLPTGQFLGAHLSGGVAIRPTDYVKPTKEQYVTLYVNPVQEQVFYDWLNQQLGKPYDLTALTGFVTGREWRGGKSWFCSELIARGLEVCGYFDLICTGVTKVTPRDLLMMLSAHEKM
jgi:uncharacterized protein YycO